MTTKYLKIIKTGSTGKTNLYDVENMKGYLLGEIKWYAPWRRYCFFCDKGYIFDKNCLEELTNTLQTLMELYQQDKAIERGG